MSAFVDGELAGELAKSAAAHIQTCPSCRKLADDYRAIGRQLASGYAQPPLNLAAKIRKRIAVERDQRQSPSARSLFLWAAALLLSCGLSAFVSWYLTHQAETSSRLQNEIVASHVRSLMQDKPVQIASSERHTVKPWFGGKIDYSPDVKDLAAQGFPLVGGRVDYVGGHRVAVLVYMRRLHVISVYLWPSPSGGSHEPQAVALHGYNGLVWATNGMTRWAVSDLNTTELRALQAALN